MCSGRIGATGQDRGPIGREVGGSGGYQRVSTRWPIRPLPAQDEPYAFLWALSLRLRVVRVKRFRQTGHSIT